jgi:hypothetical protein
MTSGQETLLAIAIFAGALGTTYGWFSDKSKKLKKDQFNRDLRKQLDEERRVFEQQANTRARELERREAYLADLRKQFNAGFLQGRTWLAKFLAEADRALDESISERMRNKKRPAYKAAEEVAEARAERRLYKERLKFLEYQLLSLKEYFPFLEEYEDVILDESVQLAPGDSNVSALEESDPVLRFVAKADYDRLTTADRNQLALDRYLGGGLSPAAIGRLYERYLGYLYEKDGWVVEYHGIIKGFEDLGRDLICSKRNEVKIIQAKCWSGQKTIHEKHIFQLFGTTQLYLMDRGAHDLFIPSVSARFITTTSLSPVAQKAAEWLKIEVEDRKPLSKTFPMIKCNINQGTKEKIYHLPFDQQYDRTKILPELGEFYADTTAEAEEKGFRRAFRFSGAFA